MRDNGVGAGVEADLGLEGDLLPARLRVGRKILNDGGRVRAIEAGMGMFGCVLE